MRITDLLSKESIRLDGVSSTKKETIRAMADLMEKSGKISDKNIMKLLPHILIALMIFSRFMLSN